MGNRVGDAGLDYLVERSYGRAGGEAEGLDCFCGEVVVTDPGVLRKGVQVGDVVCESHFGVPQY